MPDTFPHPSPPPLTDVSPDQLDQVVQDYHDAGAVSVTTSKQDDGNYTVVAIFDQSPVVIPPAPVPVPAIPPPATGDSAAGANAIIGIASASAIAHYCWENRGVAPMGYIKGMALSFARVYCKWKAGDAAAVEMAKANTGDGARDALAWYSERFQAAGMNNATAGPDTLRHLFVLLVGLGLRESSGRYCEGRDLSAANVTGETAEAGMFQTSYNARFASPLMPVIYNSYLQNPSGFLEVFQEGVQPKASDLENFGTGDGLQFQQLSKSCPAFAAEFAAVGLRNIRTHWGPIDTRAAEIRPECDAMLTKVQGTVDGLKLSVV